MPAPGVTQRVNGAFDRRVFTQELVGKRGAKRDDIGGFVAEEQVVAGRIGRFPAIMAENAIDHSLGGSDTARIIAHSTFLPAGTGRGEFKRILTGAADRQILFEIVGKIGGSCDHESILAASAGILWRASHWR